MPSRIANFHVVDQYLSIMAAEEQKASCDIEQKISRQYTTTPVDATSCFNSHISNNPMLTCLVPSDFNIPSNHSCISTTTQDSSSYCAISSGHYGDLEKGNFCLEDIRSSVSLALSNLQNIAADNHISSAVVTNPQKIVLSGSHSFNYSAPTVIAPNDLTQTSSTECDIRSMELTQSNNVQQVCNFVDLYDMDKHTKQLCYDTTTDVNKYNVYPDINNDMTNLTSTPLKLETPASHCSDQMILKTHQLQQLVDGMSTPDIMRCFGYDDQSINNYAEVTASSCRLGIAQDPLRWSWRETQLWLQHEAECHGMSNVSYCNYMLNGQDICRMNFEDFHATFGQCGEILHSALSIWKRASQMNPFESAPMDAGDNFLIESYAANNLLPSPPPPQTGLGSVLSPSNSPTPSFGSTCSTLSSSSECSGYRQNCHQTGLDKGLFGSSQGLMNANNRRYSAATNTSYTARSRNQRQSKHTVHLWQFLKELLEEPESFRTCIKWTDRSRGIFKIEDSSRVAKLWGNRKNRPAMNYDKLSRSVRQYYKKGIIKKTEHSKRLVYQFCPPYL